VDRKAAAAASTAATAIRSLVLIAANTLIFTVAELAELDRGTHHLTLLLNNLARATACLPRTPNCTHDASRFKYTAIRMFDDRLMQLRALRLILKQLGCARCFDSKARLDQKDI
jgi:hypothetical protein